MSNFEIVKCRTGNESATFHAYVDFSRKWLCQA